MHLWIAVLRRPTCWPRPGCKLRHADRTQADEFPGYPILFTAYCRKVRAHRVPAGAGGRHSAGNRRQRRANRRTPASAPRRSDFNGPSLPLRQLGAGASACWLRSVGSAARSGAQYRHLRPRRFSPHLADGLNLDGTCHGFIQNTGPSSD